MDEATTKRLKTALTDAKQAVREIVDAINVEGSADYHVGQAVSRLEFALTALRATQQQK